MMTNRQTYEISGIYYRIRKFPGIYKTKTQDKKNETRPHPIPQCHEIYVTNANSSQQKQFSEKANDVSRFRIFRTIS